MKELKTSTFEINKHFESYRNLQNIKNNQHYVKKVFLPRIFKENIKNAVFTAKSYHEESETPYKTMVLLFFGKTMFVTGKVLRPNKEHAKHVFLNYIYYPYKIGDVITFKEPPNTLELNAMMFSKHDRHLTWDSRITYTYSYIT